MPSRESSAIAPGRSRSPRRRRLLFFSYAPALCWRPRRRRKSPTHSPARTETLPTSLPHFSTTGRFGSTSWRAIRATSTRFFSTIPSIPIFSSSIPPAEPSASIQTSEREAFSCRREPITAPIQVFPPTTAPTLVISGAPDPTPIPEPHAWLMAAIGFAFFAFARSLGHRGRRVRPGVGVARAPQTC
jgi:hypothetical protein